jgi:hydroxymethylpyrimidine pyrophosphatase-like HAD family hydrolase
MALACDYDGTIAHDGRIDDATISALERLRRSGRKLVLVTGRELDDLLGLLPQIELFERVVAENGALLYRPASREEKPLGDPPPVRFVETLRERGVTPLSVGRVIVATWESQETTVLETIRDLGVEMQVIFNKGAVMVLPSGVNKATGLQAALGELGLSAHNVVAVGDAENDHAFLRLCECSVAVANALPALKETADWVTPGHHGSGVQELIQHLLDHDLASYDPPRHYVLLGTTEDGREVRVRPFGETIMIAGSSGSGKSTLAKSVLERLAECAYQYTIIDPEGDYQALEGPAVLGEPKRPPTIDEICKLLEQPHESLVVNLVGIALDDRPQFFARLLPRIEQLRASHGRPHWLVVDEAHHLFPASWEESGTATPQLWHGLLLITVHPEHVSAKVTAKVDRIVAVGSHPRETIENFCRVAGKPAPAVQDRPLDTGEVILWNRRTGEKPFSFRITPPKSENHRHKKKYAEGNLEERSFVFRGPDNKLNLKAQNVTTFLQMAAGVDDSTWLWHLQHGDYSRWFRENIKDEALSAEVERIERRPGVSASESRDQIRALVEERYTLPA